VRRSIGESEAFNEAILQHLGEVEEMTRARDTLFAVLLVTAGAGLQEVVAEELLVADLAGRFEVAISDQGVELAEATWVDLPPKEAISYFRKKKIMTNREFRELEDAYKARGFTVAGLKNRYAIDRTHALLSEAIETGTTRRDFIKKMGAQFKKWGLDGLGKHHLETIFDTNVLNAYAAGRYAQMSRPGVLKARPFWQYKTAGDGNVRRTHKAMNRRVFPASSPVWETWYPPNGYRCRCGVFSLAKDDVENEGLKVEEDAPRQAEVDGLVVQVLPDQGFGGSPRTQARADAVVARMRKQVRRHRSLSAPELTRVKLPKSKASRTQPARPPVFSSAGDLLRVEDLRRNAKVDRLAGLTRQQVIEKAEGDYFFNVYPKGLLDKVPKGETWVEVSLYSQNLDTAEQLVRRLAGVQGMGHLVDQIKVASRASYGRYNPGKWPDPEVPYDKAIGKALKVAAGDEFVRSTETVLRFVCKNDEELDAARHVAIQAEKGHGHAVRRAWGVADIRVRGEAKEGQGFSGAVLNRRKLGSGEQVVLDTAKRPGWQHEEVQVNDRLAGLLD